MTSKWIWVNAAYVVEGTESILKKQSVRLYLRIFPFEKGFKKSGDNSDRKNDPNPKRSLMLA